MPTFLSKLKRIFYLPEDKLEKVAQVGYAAKGVIYLLIGMLSLQLVFTSQGKTAGTKDAIRTIYEQPFGRVMLAVITVGLVCYALWRFVHAFVRPEKSDDEKGVGDWFARFGFLISGGTHTTLAIFAGMMALTSADTSDESTKQRLADEVMMNTSWGKYAVMAVGVGFVVTSLAQFYRAYSPSFLDKLERDLDADTLRWLERIFRAGQVSRGITFGIIASFFISAGWYQSAGKIKGLSGALTALLAQPYGAVLLTCVATGLICYAISCLVKARYRRVAYAGRSF